MTKPAIVEIYQDRNQLRRKVTYGPDGVDDAVLARAEAAIAGMHDDFLAWAEADVDAAQRLYDEAQALPAMERMVAMGRLFAIAHSMKGQGGSFGFPLVTQVADSLARFLAGQHLFTDREMDVIHVHVDALRMIVAERLAGEGGYTGEKMLNGLHKVLKKFSDHTESLGVSAPSIDEPHRRRA
jgi:hypothetical protein